MNIKEIESTIQKSGMSIAKDKLADALRRSAEKQLPCIKETNSSYVIVRVKVA